MKPKNFRYGEAATAAPESVPDRRLLSILRHENQNLRALLEGKGQLAVDPDLQAKLDQERSRAANLQQRLNTIKSEQDRWVGLEKRLGARVAELEQKFVEQATILRETMEERAQRRIADEQLASLNRQLTSEQSRSAELTSQRDRQDAELSRLAEHVTELHAELDQSLQAKQDVQRLLTRLAATPLAPILRRRQGYREFERRWLG